MREQNTPRVTDPAHAEIVGLDGAPYGGTAAPHNLEAEKALLGAVFIDNRALDDAAGIVAGADFHYPVHGRIFETALELFRRGDEANPVTLRHMFEDDADLAEAGGGAYLAHLAAAAVTVRNAAHYARMVNELAVRREALGLRRRWSQAMADSRVDAFSAAPLIAELRGALDALDARLPAAAVATTLGAAAEAAGARIEDAWRKQGALPGITTGLVDLDSRLGGLQAPDLVVLAGRPGMGKTALGLGMALAAAGAGVRTAVFSLEMSAAQLGLRALALKTEIAAERLHRGAVAQGDFDKILNAQQALAALPLHIDDSAGLTAERIAGAAHRLKRQGLGLVIVDHLGHVRPPRPLESAARVHQITHITGAFKALAKELAVPVVVLSQLSRAVNARESKRPQLSDLRDSGSIEQDADVVLTLYRDAYYMTQEEPRADDPKHAAWVEKLARVRSLAELHLLKNRHGPTGRIDLYFDAACMGFGAVIRRGEARG